MDYKSSVESAIHNFIKKSDRKQNPTRTNQKPEKEVVQKLLKELKTLKFSLHTVESKSVYNPNLGRYISQQAQSGFSDIVGNDCHGFSVYIEVKAPGKKSTLRQAQREFLSDKIHHNAFAGVFDSVELFLKTYQAWLNYRKDKNLLGARTFLFEQLPKKGFPRSNQNLAHPDFGF